MTTSPSYPPSSAPRTYTVPGRGADPARIKSFLETFFDYYSTYRSQLMREWSLAKSFYESVQWVRLDSGTDPRRAVRWTQQNPAEDIPKPVQNEIIAIFDNEVAKLGRRQSKPYVRATNADTASRGGASLANDVLNWHLDTPTVAWPSKRRKGIFRMVLYGTGIWKSFWETDYRDAVKVGSTEAVRCSAGCDFTLSSPKIPAALLDKVPTGAPIAPDETKATMGPIGIDERTTSYTASGCFSCSSPLEPVTLLPGEAKGSDPLGRSLSQPLAKGDAQIEVTSPFDFFVINEGIDEDPTAMEWFGQVTPRTLDYIANHYDVEVREDGYYKDGERIKPDDPVTIAKHHPLLGEYGYWSGGARSSLDRSIFRNHALVYEFYCQPTRRYPKGRMIVMAGNLILADDDLMQPSRSNDGTLYPRVKYNIAQFWPRDGEFFGQGICVPLFSPQMRINMTWSQIVDNRERNGNSGIMLTKGMRLLSPGWAKNYAGRTAVWEPDPENPEKSPVPLQSTLMDPRVFQELDRTRDYMQQAAGAQDVDIGKAPRNVSAATAIQLLQERASERRDTREQSLRECFKSLYSHHLLLLAEKVIEDRDYVAPGKGKSWEVKQFIGQKLKGFTNVVIDEEAGYDLRAFEREGLIQAMQLKLLVPETPFARREVAKAMGLPMSPLDEENVQVDDAERKWFLFRDHQEVPVIDPSEDSHFLHWQVYGKFLKSDDGIDMKEQARWNEVLPLIAGWEDKLAQAVMMDQQVRQMQAMAAQGIQVQLPTDAPEQMMLPAAIEDQILVVWARMMEAKQKPLSMDESDFQTLFIRFKAVTEGHRLLGERKKAAEIMGGPQLAAPGGGMTPAGTEPAPTSPDGGPAPGSSLGAGAPQTMAQAK